MSHAAEDQLIWKLRCPRCGSRPRFQHATGFHGAGIGCESCPDTYQQGDSDLEATLEWARFCAEVALVNDVDRKLKDVPEFKYVQPKPARLTKK